MNVKHLFLLVSTLLLSGALMADNNLLRTDFKNIDVDHDGYINFSEANASGFLVENWNQIDLNTDNRLDESEVIAFEVASTFVPPIDADEPEIGPTVY